MFIPYQKEFQLPEPLKNFWPSFCTASEEIQIPVLFKGFLYFAVDNPYKKNITWQASNW